MRLEKDYEELLGLFNKNKVRYCVVGAFAVAFYSHPRYTKDMDILVEPTVRNAEKVVKALEEFGFGGLKLSPADFTQEGRIIQLGYPPVRIDLLTSVKGVSFKIVWKRRTRGRYGDQKVNFIGMSELKRNKRAVKRDQDLLDLKALSNDRNPRGKKRQVP